MTLLLVVKISSELSGGEADRSNLDSYCVSLLTQ